MRPRKAILKKMSAALLVMEVVSPSVKGLEVAREENIPLGDGILIATALENRLPVAVSNDRHIEKTASKFGLIVENPLSRPAREGCEAKAASLYTTAPKWRVLT